MHKFLVPFPLLAILLLPYARLGAQEIDLHLKKEEIAVQVCLTERKPKIHFPKSALRFLQVEPSTSPNCLNYRYSYREALKKDRKWIQKQGQSYLSRMDYWLFAATNANSKDINLHLSHPPEWQYSVPWPRSKIKGTYKPQPRNFDWPGIIAFGQLQQEQLSFGPHRFDLSYTAAIPQSKRIALKPWLERALGSLSHRFGALASKSTQVTIRSSRGNEAVPFGQVLRGGGGSLHFYINHRYPVKQFLDDWTAYHEVSHLLLPFINRSDAWVSEGFASYWQYLLMVDSGQIEAKEFWRRFYNGIRRGEKSWRRTKHLSLNEATESMFSLGAVRRAYWSGAVVFFNLDFALRARRDAGPRSLEAVITAFNETITDKNDSVWIRSWSAKDLSLALDKASQSNLFSRAFQAAGQAKEFPNYKDNFLALGIIPEGDSLKFANKPNDLRLAFTDKMHGMTGKKNNGRP